MSEKYDISHEKEYSKDVLDICNELKDLLSRWQTENHRLKKLNRILQKAGVKLFSDIPFRVLNSEKPSIGGDDFSTATKIYRSIFKVDKETKKLKEFCNKLKQDLEFFEEGLRDLNRHVYISECKKFLRVKSRGSSRDDAEKVVENKFKEQDLSDASSVAEKTSKGPPEKSMGDTKQSQPSPERRILLGKTLYVSVSPKRAINSRVTPKSKDAANAPASTLKPKLNPSPNSLGSPKTKTISPVKPRDRTPGKSTDSETPPDVAKPLRKNTPDSQLPVRNRTPGPSGCKSSKYTTGTQNVAAPKRRIWEKPAPHRVEAVVVRCPTLKTPVNRLYDQQSKKRTASQSSPGSEDTKKTLKKRPEESGGRASAPGSSPSKSPQAVTKGIRFVDKVIDARGARGDSRATTILSKVNSLSYTADSLCEDLACKESRSLPPRLAFLTEQLKYILELLKTELSKQ